MTKMEDQGFTLVEAYDTLMDLKREGKIVVDRSGNIPRYEV